MGSGLQQLAPTADGESAGEEGQAGRRLVLLDTGCGPTLAFKDIGQQLVAQLLNYYLGRSKA